MDYQNVVRFKPNHLGGLPPGIEDLEIFKQIGPIKPELYDRGIIGIHEQGVYEGSDYGNLSVRISTGDYYGSILISASRTSRNRLVTPDDFTIVTKFDPQTFSADYLGVSEDKPPSSEVPFHCTAISFLGIDAVIHGHVKPEDPEFEVMKEMMENGEIPFTKSPYGTLALGNELDVIIRRYELKPIVIGMDNHFDEFGVITYGRNLEEAFNLIIKFYERLRQKSRS